LSVALGVIGHPPPQILARILHSELCLPVQFLVCLGRVGSQIQNITLPSWNHLVGHISTDDLAEGVDNLEDGAATAGPQVPSLDARLLLAEIVQSSKVTFGQINNVDVIANGGTVSGRVI
jgi:hypothetical protein